MIIGQELSEGNGELKLQTSINTDEEEHLNWESVQAGKGFIRDSKNRVIGREIARIPVEEAAMLEAMCDIDYLSFSRTGDKKAFKRLLSRFPYWRSCEGGI